jgi:hypothetical protein
LISSSENVPEWELLLGNLVLRRSDRPKCPIREDVASRRMGRRPTWLQRETEPDCCCSYGGYSTNDGGRTDSQTPAARTRPQKVSICTRHVDGSPTDPALRCRLVRPTPIYDQLRGERINADVPATVDEPQPVDQGGKHRLAAGGPGPVVVFGRPPRSRPDLGVTHRNLGLPQAEAPDHPASAAFRTAAHA